MSQNNNITPDWGKIILIIVLFGLTLITVINYLIQSKYI